MKCTNCKKDIIIPVRAYLNLESYNVGGSCIVVSECCGAGYTIEMKVSYKTMPYIGEKKEDDWGQEMLKLKEN